MQLIHHLQSSSKAHRCRAIAGHVQFGFQRQPLDLCHSPWISTGHGKKIEAISSVYPARQPATIWKLRKMVDRFAHARLEHGIIAGYPENHRFDNPGLPAPALTSSPSSFGRQSRSDAAPAPVPRKVILLDLALFQPFQRMGDDTLTGNSFRFLAKKIPAHRARHAIADNATAGIERRIEILEIGIGRYTATKAAAARSPPADRCRNVRARSSGAPVANITASYNLTCNSGDTDIFATVTCDKGDIVAGIGFIVAPRHRL